MQVGMNHVPPYLLLIIAVKNIPATPTAASNLNVVAVSTTISDFPSALYDVACSRFENPNPSNGFCKNASRLTLTESDRCDSDI